MLSATFLKAYFERPLLYFSLISFPDQVLEQLLLSACFVDGRKLEELRFILLYLRFKLPVLALQIVHSLQHAVLVFLGLLDGLLGQTLGVLMIVVVNGQRLPVPGLCEVAAAIRGLQLLNTGLPLDD